MADSIEENIATEQPQIPVEEEPVPKAEENEFSYIKENGFTSEIFKVEIRGLPKYYGIGVGDLPWAMTT